jgi:diketogulonate reductase-like aldo/keto reductase
MRENFDGLDFELDEVDVNMLDGLDEGKDGALFPANVSG